MATCDALGEVLRHIQALPATTATQRRASTYAYSFATKSFSEQLAIWDSIWKNGNDFWASVHAFFFLERNMRNEKALRQMWPVVVKWQDYVNDWDLCDALAKIYTKVLQVLPREVYAQLKKWNRSRNLWKRRQSVVSLLYYSRTKTTYLPYEKIIALITPLITDPEYYVQKGVGWALREAHTVYPQKTFGFFKKSVRHMSSIAFTIATEKLNAAEKRTLKLLRKR